MTPPTSLPAIPKDLAAILSAGPPLQQAFPWSRDKWTSILQDLPDVVETLNGMPDRVDRRSISGLADRELKAGRVLPAFVPTMVWGYGTTAYGPGRVRWVLTGVGNRSAAIAPVLPAVADKLAHAIEVAQSEGNVAAYRYLYSAGRVKHLGGAFFTKWLYFATNGGNPDSATAAPILDKRVANWLWHNDVVQLRTDTTDSYGTYTELLAGWSQASGRTPTVIERSIFELARS